MFVDAVRLVVGTLTAVRVGPPRQVDRRVAGLAMVLSPLAVLPLAILVAVIVGVGPRVGLPPLVIGLLTVGALAVGTRVLHLDGLSDTADGLTASYDRDRSLEVMKGGTAGPAGVVAVVVVLGLQAAGFAGLSARESLAAAALAGLAVCVSRAALVIGCARGVKPAREDGLGRTFTETVPPVVAAAVWIVAGLALAGATAWLGFGWWRGALAALVALLVVLAIVHRTVRRFGGVTGDVLGAAIELALAALLVALT